MNFVNPNTENLSVTYNDITYSYEYYKPAITMTGVTDEAYSDWLVGTTYATGDYVIVPELKRIYRSTSDSNIGNFPAINGSTNWVDWGNINSYNAFASDENIGARTVGVDGVLEFDFSKSNTLAGIDIDFESAHMMLLKTDGLNYLSDYDAGTTYAINDAVVYNGVFYVSLVNSNTANTPDVSATQWDQRDDLVYFDEVVNGLDYGALTYGEYFYTDSIIKKRVVMTGFEWLPTSIMRIKLTGDFALGSIVYGIEEDMGCTLVGSSLSLEDKSTISTDEITGYRKVTRYGSVRVLDCSVIFDTDDFNVIAQKAEGILSRNILWMPTDLDKFSDSITIGYIERFDIPMENISKTQTQTTIVGVIR